MASYISSTVDQHGRGQVDRVEDVADDHRSPYLREPRTTTSQRDVHPQVREESVGPNPIDSLWAAYKVTGAREFRDQLILHYAPLVKYGAGRLASGMPRNVELADLTSYGMLGLMDAIEKFELGRGCKFETYATYRIKGAIRDELRALDWVPRSVRVKARALETALARLEGELGRVPTDAEWAADLHLDVRQLRTALGDIANVGLLSLDQLVLPTGNDTTRIGDSVADGSEGPVASYAREERREWLVSAIDKMSKSSRIVLTLYYYENLSLAQIGRVLGVTESRVCQIRTKALLRLRSRLAAADREPVKIFWSGETRPIGPRRGLGQGPARRGNRPPDLPGG